MMSKQVFTTVSLVTTTLLGSEGVEDVLGFYKSILGAL